MIGRHPPENVAPENDALLMTKKIAALSYFDP